MRSPWLEAPPPDDNEHYGLDADGRVRIIRRRIQGNVQVVEYSPTRVRSLVIDDTGVLGVDDVYLDGGRYGSSVSVNIHGWSLSSFEYDGDRFVSIWSARYVEDDPNTPGVAVMTRTASYDQWPSAEADHGAGRPRGTEPAVTAGGRGRRRGHRRHRRRAHGRGGSVRGRADWRDRRDLAAYPPNGTLARFVLRWFEWRDPSHVTLHALGTDDEYAHEDAWLPLEWSNLDDELERTQRLLDGADIAQTSANLGPIYELVEDIPDEHPPPPAIRAVIQRLPQALAAIKDRLLRRRGLPLRGLRHPPLTPSVQPTGSNPARRMTAVAKGATSSISATSEPSRSLREEPTRDEYTTFNFARSNPTGEGQGLVPACFGE